MKKSTIYYMAQVAVLTNGVMTPGEKLEILRELIDREGTAIFVEERELREAQKKAEQESAE